MLLGFVGEQLSTYFVELVLPDLLFISDMSRDWVYLSAIK